MEQKKFKYQEQIDELLAIGCKLPTLYAPNNLEACRFVFSDTKHQNHVPQYMSNLNNTFHITKNLSDDENIKRV